EQATITASPAAGYAFVNWTEGGSVISTHATYTFTVNSHRSFQANYSQNTYTVSVSTSPSSGGTVTGGGNYNHGEQATITASPAAGYAFVNWTEGGSVISTNATYTFTVNSNRSFQANYSQNTYTVSVSNSPSSGGTATGGGNYAHGSQATITASPSTGYAFVNWTEGGSVVSTNASYTFTVNSNRSFQANYSQNTYTVGVSNSPSSGGTATGGGTFAHGAQATITASPAAGYAFVNWTEGGSIISTNATYTFTVNSNRNFQANFSQNTYTVNVSNSPTSGGTATGGGNYTHGSQATISASPSAGYSFVNWTEGGSFVSTNPSYTFTVNSNRSFQANYSLNSYRVSVSNSPTSGGTATGGGDFTHGSQATVSANPSSGYSFVNWTEGGSFVSANPSYTFTVTADRTLVANFSQIVYNVSITSSPTSGGTTNGAGPYGSGSTANIIATPATGYRFVNWTRNGAIVSTSANYSFTVTGNTTLVANFAVASYTITTSVNPAGTGTASGGGSFNHGASVTVRATPASGYQFTNWTENGTEVSRTANYVFTVTENRNLRANFSQIPRLLSLTGPSGTALNNNDVLDLENSDGGSLVITVSANADWTVAENSLWFSAVKESDTRLRLNYMDNISVVDKEDPLHVTTAMGAQMRIIIRQRARVSQISLSGFGKTELYPNPAGDKTLLRFAEEHKGKIRISIMSFQGILVKTEEYYDIQADQTIELDLATVPSGQYLMLISGEDGHKTLQLIKL
ncbi:MAG: T9SS type A sorting domain-containing protein, partial [Bacteroidota bacterium]|nr:T9SS type A sorting domain-containing protein [Bacteroidota bacterium]